MKECKLFEARLERKCEEKNMIFLFQMIFITANKMLREQYEKQRRNFLIMVMRLTSAHKFDGLNSSHPITPSNIIHPSLYFPLSSRVLQINEGPRRSLTIRHLHHPSYAFLYSLLSVPSSYR
jgi:hypothetical protein